jgi:predicted DNA-binding ribbon-helix-helix protein
MIPTWEAAVAAKTRAPKIVKRSVVIQGHSTSITLEDDFRLAQKKVANDRGQTFTSLFEEIDFPPSRGPNLSSSIRVYLFELAGKGAI